MARWGALACFVAAVLPFERGRNMWSYFPELFDQVLGRNVRPAVGGVREWTVLIFCSLAVPFYFCGPVYALLCSSKAIHGKISRRVLAGLLWTLWLATVATPYVAVCKQLSARDVLPDTIGVTVTVLSIYLLICGLSVLASRRMRHTPVYIFSMGLVPIGMLFLSETCLVALMLINAFRTFDWYLIDIPLGWLGALMLLVGWLKWWGAVKRDMREAAAAKNGHQAPPDATAHASGGFSRISSANTSSTPN